MTETTFLIEIGTEELPLILRNLAESFATYITIELNNAHLTYGEVNWYATPRRLALKISRLNIMQQDRKIEKRGPTIAAAFDSSGMPTKAAEGWASRCGITVDQANRLQTDKGEWLVYRTYVPGNSVQALLPTIITNALAKLPVSKLMRWGNGDVQFIRPVHTITLLLGNELIPATILGIKSDRILHGHRFMGEKKVVINNADQYPQILEIRGKVIADYEVRKARIKADVEMAARRIGGFADLSDKLLEEITSLVEWPVVLIASFDKEFLTVPTSALVCTMKNNQKYFPVYDKEGNLLPNFIFVANIESSDPQNIILGNEKVMRPRLADAKFFFETDKKKRLEDNLPNLKSVLFQQKLGTLRDKTDRIQVLAGWIAGEINADSNLVARAGLLSKCDLMTKMVSEFTDTQGMMGMHYALHDGEAKEVAMALNEQYQPRFFGDKLPSSLVSCALAIADRMDTLTGILGIGQYPKKDKDPFALRRTALSILHIIVGKQLSIDLRTLTEKAVYLYNGKLTNKKVIEEVIDFMLGRFRAWYQKKGYSIDTIQAVLACRPTHPVDFDARIRAISHFRTIDVATDLIVTNKRISNILAKAKIPLNECIQASLLKESEEIKLATFVIALESKLRPWLAEGRYQDALIELVQLREVVDNFFKKVLVNTEEKAVRINRLLLLAKLRALFLQIADISLLQ